MNRREFIKTSATVSAGLLAGCSLQKIISAGDTPKGEYPNIVIIYADDLGYGDLSCYGGDIPTPNIDSIASNGIRFTDFYVSAPACTPSRYSLLTGCYPQRSLHGLSSVYMPGDNRYFDRIEKTLAEYLKHNGYTTAIMGKWHLGVAPPASNLPMSHGFDVFCGLSGGAMDYFTHRYATQPEDWYVNNVPTHEEGYATDLITDHGITFVDARTADRKRFFLFLSYTAPHYGKTDPNNVPPGTLIMSTGDHKGINYANTLQAKQEHLDRFSHVSDVYRRYYSAMVSCMDDNVGRFLARLKASGQYDNTMIWFISDNGGYSQSYHGHADNGPLRGQKATLYEGGIRVPAMVCWKNRIKSRQTMSQPLCTIDLVPTIGAITGYGSKLLCNRPIDGRNISSVLFKNAPIKRDLYWKRGPARAFRRGKWKMLGKHLYDLEADITESNNLAHRKKSKYKELNDAWTNFDNRITPYTHPK